MLALNNNRRAFLDTISVSEGTSTINGSDNGYNVLVGGGLFDGYADHPRQLVVLPRLHLGSTAAGRYQILARNYDAYKKLLGLKDFSPASQDQIALQLVKEQGALADVDAGRIATAIAKCANIWASFPGAGYGQHENRMTTLCMYFKHAGGILAA